LRHAFAPNGALRASINLGNPILAYRQPDGRAAGVSVDQARALGAECKGLQISSSAAAEAALRDFVERARTSGFVAQALARHQVKGALVAPRG